MSNFAVSYILAENAIICYICLYGLTEKMVQRKSLTSYYKLILRTT